MSQRFRLPADRGSAEANVPQLISAPLSLLSAQPTFSTAFAATVRRFPMARCRSQSQKSDGWVVVDVATGGGSRSRLRSTVVMINLIDESMKATLPVQALGPTPATSFLDDNEGGPLFRKVRAMPRNERKSLVVPQMPILSWRILLPSCRYASSA